MFLIFFPCNFIPFFLRRFVTYSFLLQAMSFYLYKTFFLRLHFYIKPFFKAINLSFYFTYSIFLYIAHMYRVIPPSPAFLNIPSQENQKVNGAAPAIFWQWPCRPTRSLRVNKTLNPKPRLRL